MTPITIRAHVAASLTHTWTCWTSPEHITQWNFAGDDWHCPSATNDLRTGGKFTSRMEARDGSFGFDFEGIYDQVIPFALIRYSMEDGRKVEIRFEEAGNGTVVTETFDPESENPVDMQRDGWQMILNNFKRHAEG